MASLSRKFLSGIGIEEDKIELILEKHQEVLGEIKDERDRLKEDAEKLPSVEKELSDLKEATKDGKENSYKVKYEALKEDFENYKKDISTKEIHSKKEAAYRELLKAAGISEKRIDAVLKVSPIDSLEFDDEGKVKEADSISKTIKEEWADFIPTESVKGAQTATPPASNGSSLFKTKEEIVKIKDTSERQKAWKDYLNQKASQNESQKG